MDEWNGTFEKVNPREIVIDHRYQRSEKPILIARIAENPDWAAFGALSCYRRDGLLVCVDGQQRLRGILSTDKPPLLVPCVIQEKAPVEKEARTFVTVNVNRTSVQSLEKHRGLVMAKDPAALAINRSVETAGFSLGQRSGTENPHTISAVASIYNAYNVLGEEGLLQLLVQLRDSWPNDGAAVGASIINGVRDVLVDLGDDYNRAKVTAALAKTSPALIMRKAKEIEFDIGGSMQINVRRAINKLCKL
jgi:hypothetical protein